MGLFSFALFDLELELAHGATPVFALFLFGIFCFSLSFVGVLFNQQNYLIVLLGLELMLLSLNILYIFCGCGFYIFQGFIFSLILLALAGVESAIGLCFLLNIFFVFKIIEIDNFLYLKG